MSEFARADSALNEVLGEAPDPAEPEAPEEHEAVAAEANPGHVDIDAENDSQAPAEEADDAVSVSDFPEAPSDLVEEADWLCSEDEARQMVDRARTAIAELDSSLRQIIERRAWEPLGYNDPKEFVLAELGPATEGGKSKAQAYRLARLAMFLYRLAESFGDDSLLMDVSERSLRAIPPGVSGENDEVLADRVASRIDALDTPTEEAAKAVWDEEYERARDEIADTGRLSRPDEDASGGGGGGQWDEVPDGGDYEEDTFSLRDVTDTDEDEDEDSPEWETQTASRLDYVDVHGVGDEASEATITYVEALREVMSGLSVLVEASQHLPDIVEYATDEEIAEAAEMAEATDAMTKALRAAAEERDDEIAL